MLNIRTLQILVEVARQGGFSRAAQTVHAVQPTVSKAVQAVEDRLGVRIFERANNGVRLTVEGEIVYRRALNILQEFEALEADVAALHKLEKGVLRIGFPPVASGILFADLLSKYRQLYPGINISLQEQGCASLEPMVLSGDLDLAVTPSRRIFRGSRFGTNRSWSSCPRIIPSPIANASKWMNWQTTPSSASSRVSCSTTASRPSAASAG